MKFRLSSSVAPIFLGSLFCTVAVSATPTLTKLTDFQNALSGSNPILGPANPNDSPILIGNKLWFTCEAGGDGGKGTISSYDLATNTLAVELSMDNTTGLTPKAAPVRDGDFLYVTTIGGSNGGTGSVYSTLFRYNMVTEEVDPYIWEATGSSGTAARTPQGGVTVIDRGDDGKDLYFNCYSGGTGSNGAILRCTISNDPLVAPVTTTIYNFPNSPGGRFPEQGFTAVGSDLYFTTFNGGSGTTFGILGKLNVAIHGGETVTTLASMPTATEDYARLPAHNPYYRTLDNSLYFTTVGSNSQPGALMKFDLTTNTLSFLHKIQGGPSTANFP